MTRQEYARDVLVEISKYIKQINLGVSPGSNSLSDSIREISKESTLQLVNSNLSGIKATLNSIDKASELSNWNYTPGNSQTITYYAASVPGNPTTSLSNVESISYVRLGTLQFTQNFIYNSSGDVISITTT